jgi:hypothetical protein
MFTDKSIAAGLYYITFPICVTGSLSFLNSRNLSYRAQHRCLILLGTCMVSDIHKLQHCFKHLVTGYLWNLQPSTFSRYWNYFVLDKTTTCLSIPGNTDIPELGMNRSAGEAVMPCRASAGVCGCVRAGHTAWLIMPYHPVQYQTTNWNSESCCEHCYSHMPPWTLAQAVVKLFYFCGQKLSCRCWYVFL